MKVNIQKLQQGGGFATFTPIINPSPGTSRSTKSTSEEPKSATSSLLDDATFKELLTKGGLTNDVNNLVSELIKLENASANPFNSGNNRSMALRMIGKVNELRQSKNMWEDAVKAAKESGGLGEIAVGSSGEVYIKDEKNNIKAVSLEAYKEDPEIGKVLSVSELMSEREYNPQLTGKNSVLHVASNSVGLNKITDHINSIISAFGTETTEDSKFYTKQQVTQQLTSLTGVKPTEEVKSAMQTLYSIASSPGELYKVSTTNSSERRQALKAVDYIWKTLGTNAQQKLTATAVISGEKDPRQFILSMIANQTNETNKMEIAPAKMPGEGSGDGSDDGFKNKPITPFELFHNGKTGKQIFNWNDPTTGKTFDLVATGINRIATIDGKPLGMTTLKTVLNTEVGTLVDTNKAFFGDQVVTANDLQNIIYDGNAGARVYMPVTASGAPDYNKLKQIQELEKQIFSDKSLSPEQINEIFQKRGLSYIQVDGNKQYIMNDRFKPFLVMYGYTGEDANSVKNNAKIKALSSSEEDGVIQSLKDTWKNDKVAEPPIGFDWTTTYYSGMIAIPYRDDSSMYAASIAKNFLAPQVTLDHARVAQNEANATRLNASSSLIF